MNDDLTPDELQANDLTPLPGGADSGYSACTDCRGPTANRGGVCSRCLRSPFVGEGRAANRRHAPRGRRPTANGSGGDHPDDLDE